MAMRKRTSKILDSAELRANSLETVDPNLDLGSNLTLSKYKQAIADGRAKLNAYNQTLTLADQQGNDLSAAEKVIRDFSARMLAGIGATRGTDSNEYEMAGGTRKSERKRVSSKKKPS
jgi:hypothetical protein